MLTSCGAPASAPSSVPTGVEFGIELEGIEGGKLFGFVGLGGGKSGYDMYIGFDGDEFARAMSFHHRVVNHVAGGEAGCRDLDSILFLTSGVLPVMSAGCHAHRLERGEARPPDRAHHAVAVAHV